jgi:hypothetical protein
MDDQHAVRAMLDLAQIRELSDGELEILVGTYPAFCEQVERLRRLADREQDQEPD